MAYMKEYGNNRESRAEQARRHTEEMEQKYGEQIREAIKNTIVYDVDFQSSDTYSCETEITVEAADSVSAVMKHSKECNGPMAVLNFSSYKNPGGGFIGGSKAQEECLCQESCLYNILTEFAPSFYEWNRQHNNKTLYLNRGLYVPKVVFCKEGNTVLCDVITCAAPNKSAAQANQKVSDQENTEALKSRIRFVLDIAKENHVELLILGAYGCGVFGQDAREVAGIFKEYLSTTHKCFRKVIFAIPKGRDNHLEVFEEVLGK